MKQKLFNPFIQVAGLKALGIGLIFLVASTLLAWTFNTNFDGVIDVHFGGSSKFYNHLVFNLVNVFSLIIIYYLIAAFLTQGKTRLIDIAGTMSLARFPFVIVPLLNIGNINTLIGEKIIYGMQDQIGRGAVSLVSCNPCTITTFEYIYLFFSSIILLLVIAWYIILLFNAYKISTNLKGAKVIISFIVGLILAEISSSILIRFIL